MSELAPAAPVAPTNGAHPTTPQKPAIVKPTQDVKQETKPEVDDSEEYVVDGKTTRLNKEQRKLHFQKALAADKRLKEAADEKAKTADFWKEFDADPEAAIAKRGLDPSKVFAAHLEKKAKLELMTQEQRDLAAQKERADAAEAKAKKYEDEKRSAYQSEMDAKHFQALESQLISAADKHGLDSSPDTLEGLCDIALEFIEHEVPITADQVAQEYTRRDNERLDTMGKKLLAVLKGPKLLKYLGEPVLAEIKAALSQADVDSLKDIPKPQAKIKVAAHERAVRPKSGHINENAFDKKFGL